MQQFAVDDELALLVERLAKAKPFENLSFNEALWRVFLEHNLIPADGQSADPLDRPLAGARMAATAGSKKAVTPNVSDWVASVPELKNRKGLTSWKAVCTLLRIDTAGDSARRKLKNWVKINRPGWSPVPDID
jgi:hypothetical protein